MWITLTGFMGCGKSTIAKAISACAAYDFVDTDELVESQAGTSINTIFDQHGESYFRQLEASVVTNLNPTENLVIATGGGLVCNSATVDLFKTNGPVVWVNRPWAEILTALNLDDNRPLVAINDIASLEAIYKERIIIYETVSDFEIQNCNVKPDYLAHKILEFCNES